MSELIQRKKRKSGRRKEETRLEISLKSRFPQLSLPYMAVQAGSSPHLGPRIRGYLILSGSARRHSSNS